MVSGKRGGFPASIQDHCGSPIRIDRGRIYRAQRGQRNTSVIPAVRVPAVTSLVMLLRLTLPDPAPDTPCRFDIVQRLGRQVIGGNSYAVLGREVPRRLKSR